MKCAEERKKKFFKNLINHFIGFVFEKMPKNMEEQSNEKRKEKKGIINFLSFFFSYKY